MHRFKNGGTNQDGKTGEPEVEKGSTFAANDLR